MFVPVSRSKQTEMKLMNSTFRVRGGCNITKKGVIATLAADTEELKLQASLSEAILTTGPTLGSVGDLLLSVEKPGSFIIDYDVPKKEVRFQFMNTVKVHEKQLNMTYTHLRGENQTILDGTLVLNPANKISLNYALDSGIRKLKYSYTHRQMTTIEPSYDFPNNSCNLAVSRRVLNGDVLKASYESSSKVLGLEWSLRSLMNKDGIIKVLATFNLAEGTDMPKLSAESSWNFEL